MAQTRHGTEQHQTTQVQENIDSLDEGSSGGNSGQSVVSDSDISGNDRRVLESDTEDSRSKQVTHDGDA